MICGGYEDVIYRADWQHLGSGERPRLVRGARVRDAVDVADLVSEGEHAYTFAAPGSGYGDLKILPDPWDARLDMLDGGRTVRPGSSEHFHMGGLDAAHRAWLIVRGAPKGNTDVAARAGGRDVAPLHFKTSEHWVELSVEIPAERVTPEMDFELRNVGPEEFIDYHVWVTQ